MPASRRRINIPQAKGGACLPCYFARSPPVDHPTMPAPSRTASPT